MLYRLQTYSNRVKWSARRGVHWRLLVTAGLRFVAIVALVLTVRGPAKAQDMPTAEDQATPIAGAGHGYIHQLSDTVNPATGQLSVKITLPAPPPARGARVPLSIQYDSSRYAQAAATFQMGDEVTATAMDGWSYMVPHLDYFSSDPYLATNRSDRYTNSDFLFTDAEGQIHDLSLGEVHPLPLYSNPDVLTGGDGKVKATLSLGTTPQVAVTDADGTVYTFSGISLNLCAYNEVTQCYYLPSALEDRNGNVVKFTIGTQYNSPVPPITATDSLGRTLYSVAAFGSTADTVTTPNGSYQIDWGATVNHGWTSSPAVADPSNDPDPGCPQFTGAVGLAYNQSTEISNITLPNGESYKFYYDSVSGFLDKIVYPSGGYVSYQWAIGAPSEGMVVAGASPTCQNGTCVNNVCQYEYSVPQLQSRTVSYDGTNVALEQDFSYSTTWSSDFFHWTSKETTVITHDYIAGQASTTVYQYVPYLLPADPEVGASSTGSNSSPLESEIRVYAGSGASGTPLRTVNETYALPDLPPTSVETTLDNGMVKESTRIYSGMPFQSGNLPQVTDTYDYDYGSGAPGPLLQHTHIDYKSFAATPLFPAAPSIVDKPSDVITYDGSGNPVSETDYSYDQGAVSSATATEHDEANYGSSSTAPRGNVTAVTRKCFGCADAVTTYTYDETGQVLSKTDPCGNGTCADMSGTNYTTFYSYSDSYLSGNTNTAAITPPGNTNGYLTQITYPSTNGVSHVLKFSHDYASGQLTASTDENGQETTYRYDDPFARPTEINYPDQSKTTYSYDDAPPNPTVTTTRTKPRSQTFTNEDIEDGVGLNIEHLVLNDPDCPSGDQTDTSYNGSGSVYTVSNPYCTTSDPTYGVTTYQHDALGRVTEVTNPDGSIVTNTYVGRATEIQDEGNASSDQNGQRVTRISQLDGLGRLSSICEVSSTTLPGNGGTPSSCGLDIGRTGFLTTYQYNLLGDLTAVSQSGLSPRTYQYNSLAELLSSTNPEANTVPGTTTTVPTTYSYDLNGNVSQRIAPAPNQKSTATVTTSYTYDDLNRLTLTSYSDGTTPVAAYTYDQCSSCTAATADGIGRLVHESNNVNAALTFSYDPMGRVLQRAGCIPLDCNDSANAVGETYDEIGDVQTLNTGLGVTFSYQYNPAANLTSLTSSLSDANHPGTLVSNAVHNSFGDLTSAFFGNGTAETISYAPRSWPVSATVSGTVVNSQATPGTGTATITGSEQSKAAASAIAGAGTVTISGTEQTYTSVTEQCTTYPPPIGQICIPVAGPTVYDYGTVSITVNGVVMSTSYGNGGSSWSGTSADVASSLASVINGTSSSPVTATVSGSTITLTAKTQGSATDYPLSTSASSYLSSPSFTATPSGSTLTGGTDSSPAIYDSGTVQVTVNGFQAPVSYGQGSTTASVATAIAAALNGGSQVTASVSGSTITLTASQAGASTNYSLTWSSSTGQSATFSQPSFAVETSGASLTGGIDAGDAPGTIYSYGVTYAPDGDVLTANDSVNGSWAYTYDPFNRLESAVQGTTTFTYAYDRFGNRINQEENGSCAAGPVFCVSYDANNRINDGAQTYDTAGNVIQDSMHHYYYDAENRLVQVDGTFGNCSTATACYIYYPNGQRVEKDANGIRVDYLYDPQGNQIAEVNSSGGWNRIEVYAGGLHVATYSGGTSGVTYFDHSDWLGTERASTNVSGIVCSTTTNLPFGDLQSTSGNCGDPTPMHFTGKQRDSESGLDYFGARYDSSSLGRFMSPDSSGGPDAAPYADFNDPQTLNLYSYAQNNPLVLTDPDGHHVECTSTTVNEGHMIVMVVRCHDYPDPPLLAIGGAVLDGAELGPPEWIVGGAVLVTAGGIWCYEHNCLQPLANMFTKSNNPPPPPDESKTAQQGQQQAQSPPTNKEAKQKAAQLGYDKEVKDPPFNSHGKKVFTNGRDYITPDRDAHSGGYWKKFNRAGERLGTYDENLNRIGP